MPRTIAFSLCRFSATKDGEALSSQELLDAISGLKGKGIAYRNPDPSPDDFTTILVRPRKFRHAGHDIITWIVAERTSSRARTRYNQETDDLEDELEAADDMRQTRFVAIPLLGVVGIDDRYGDKHLGAASAASRFRHLCWDHAEIEIDIIFSGIPQDVDRALNTWSLEHFNFTVRPTNPHPSKMGEILDGLLRGNNIGRFHGNATPMPDKKMGNSAHGLIAEAKGLSDDGYGQYGAKGTTPSGLRATVSSPRFNMSKEQNLKRQSENRNMRVHIPIEGSVDSENLHVVRALMELYGN